MDAIRDPYDLDRLVRAVPDFPAPGIVFRDVTPLLADPVALGRAVEALAALDGHIDAVVGIESRGFILGAPVALHTHAGFVPARKQGKLPGETIAVSFALEYGEAVLELQHGAIHPGQRVLIVDDVLATGGTAAAAGQLVEELGGEVVGMSFLLELTALGGAARLERYRTNALLRY
ncbi:MAG: adenine phosphoribosyltransferase [Nitriliruptoraceae bacterium]